MIRVLIADDDVLVCRFISQLINWEANGYELVGIARDGMQALNFLENHKPQVLITDIEMPVMDGIELLKQIRKSGNPVKVAVLSCHDDFAYVREAMRLGADEYILKDELTKDKLLQLLADLSEIAVENAPSTEDEEKKIRMELEEKQLQQLLEGTIIRLPDFTPSVVMAIRITDYDEKAALHTTAHREEFYRSFASILREQIPENADGKICHVRGGWFAGLLHFSEKLGSQEKQYQLIDMANRILHKADKHFEFNTKISIAELSVSGKDAASGWEYAKGLQGYAFYDRGRIFSSWQYEPLGKTMPQEAAAFLEKAENWKAHREADTIRAAVEESLAAFYREKTQESVVATWVRSADHIFGVKARPLPKQYEMLGEIAGQYARMSGNHLQNMQEYSESVTAVIRYIQDNYRNNISLNAAANAVHLTPTYLSYIFHKETNVTFSDYLQSCRISHAQELLERTDEKVREIGFLVGYNDNRHFCKTFKKTTGMTPQEYRKKHRH